MSKPSHRVICRNDMSTERRPSDRDVKWRPPVHGYPSLCRLKNPISVFKRLLLGSFCKTTGEYIVHLMIVIDHLRRQTGGRKNKVD